MAFTVAPTSGSQPYLLSATFTNPSFIDGVRYAINISASSTTGSCPVQGIDTPLSVAQTAYLLANGSLVISSSVSLGRCRTYTLSILRVRTGAVLETSNAYVNNL